MATSASDTVSPAISELSFICALRSGSAGHYCGANASNTLPGRPPNAPYPELTNTMPPATTGPGPIIEAPRPATPLTVVNSRFESNSQRIAPSAVEYTRNAPSFDPENTAPGITVTAADWAALQPRPVPHAGGRGGVNQARCPVASVTACSPPMLARTS